MLYHGQTQALFAAMKSAWQRVMTSHDILPRGGDKYYGTMVKLALYQYLETTATPHADDPRLRQALGALGGHPDPAWLTTAVDHLSAAMPLSWHVQDFGPTVDAETWEQNVAALLLDWMADEQRRAKVPFSKSDLFKQEMQGILQQQIFEHEPESKGKRGKSKSKHAQTPMPGSPLLPRYDILDRTLAGKFQLLSSEPYEAGALIELLPAYLHLLARLGLIHPVEMDETCATVKPLVANVLTLLERFGVDIHLLHAVATAWSDATLESLRDDPDLASARALPVVISPATPTPIPEAQFYRFKISYRGADDVWFIVGAAARHTLHDLHGAIMEATDFDDDHLHAFYLSGRAWDKTTEYGHGDARHSSGITIGKLKLRLKQRFLYIFDFGDQHEFDIQLIETRPEPLRERHPILIERHGKMPPQYPNEDDESEEEDDGENEQADAL